MDGTLLNDRKEISEENAEWIAKAEQHGMTVVLTTGRGIQNIEPYIEQLGLRSPIIAVNGGEIWEAPGKLHRRETMLPETIRALYRIACEVDSWYWAYTTDGKPDKGNWSFDSLDDETWLKFGFASEDLDQLAQIDERLKHMAGIEITSSNWTNREVGPPGISKANGIREVCKLLGISIEQCVAVGDGENDLSMIRACGLGVAMGNAPEEIKSSADQVTSSNNEHGVARLLQSVLEHNGSRSS